MFSVNTREGIGEFIGVVGIIGWTVAIEAEINATSSKLDLGWPSGLVGRDRDPQTRRTGEGPRRLVQVVVRALCGQMKFIDSVRGKCPQIGYVAEVVVERARAGKPGHVRG